MPTLAEELHRLADRLFNASDFMDVGRVQAELRSLATQTEGMVLVRPDINHLTSLSEEMTTLLGGRFTATIPACHSGHAPTAYGAVASLQTILDAQDKLKESPSTTQTKEG